MLYIGTSGFRDWQPGLASWARSLAYSPGATGRDIMAAGGLPLVSLVTHSQEQALNHVNTRANLHNLPAGGQYAAVRHHRHIARGAARDGGCPRGGRAPPANQPVG